MWCRLIENWFPQPAVRVQSTVATLLVAAGVVTAMYQVRLQLDHGWSRDSAMAMASWMRTHLPNSARIFQVDSSGATAYFSERSVINGDGLINSWDFQEHLRSGRLQQHLIGVQANYLLLDNFHESRPIKVGVPFWTDTRAVISFPEAPTMVVQFGRFALFPMDPKRILVSYDNVGYW